MNTLKRDTINHIISVEGGHVNNPNDSGGETNFGITQTVARSSGYHGPMVDLPRCVAFDIYATRYWDSLGLDQVVEISQSAAVELADTGVNMGTGRAAEFLQRSLNALNNQGKLFDDLVIDRDIGPSTTSALKAYIKARSVDGETVLCRALNALQGAYYIELAERRQKDESFVYGWLLNRVS